MLFVTLSSVLWFWTTLYAVGYLEDSPRRSRFFGFFSLCVTSTVGIALAANLITFLIFYELLTISTFPLVVHRGTRKALHAAGSTSPTPSAAGTVLLLAVAWLQSIAGPVAFTERGALHAVVASHPTQLTDHLLSLHRRASASRRPSCRCTAGSPGRWWRRRRSARCSTPWRSSRRAPSASCAWSTTSTASRQRRTTRPAATAGRCWRDFTIIYGSVRALVQDDLKKRLAYSTVSQVSYITLGTAIFGPLATIGGIVHLVHQGIMKITLFFAAGNYAETLGIHRVSEMNGVGRRMPWTTAAFTVAALGMIGVPPLAGFVSKFYLKQGAIAAGSGVGHPGPRRQQPAQRGLLPADPLPCLVSLASAGRGPTNATSAASKRHWMLLVPPLFTAAMVVLAGVLADSSFSPLAWARIIARREYGP